ncbi:hypothetical protein [Massilia sp. BSC265]|uniref:hypothetical protein n=1 Tax=Massilia sp. BSC265 TaxID=1549812 RepID=UPI0004E91256|nr:hypothetical protein [Massilia sp. BSC265]KFI08970.1 hypothetical protein JN27_00820 [Massilia sp. BSC265]
MLTSTYTLVTLSIEQASARIGLQSLLERWQGSSRQHAKPTPREMKLACDTLRVAFDNCYWRKLDKFVVPALRRAGAADDAVAGLLAELDALTLAAIEARADAHAAAAVHDPGFSAALERCCNLLLKRLEREERELFPLARVHVPSEVWFAIANQMLIQDAWQNENRGYGSGQVAAGAMAGNSLKQSVALSMPHYATH